MLSAPRWLGLAALLLASGAAAQGEDPAALMAQLEARVLGAQRVRIEADIQARGLIDASLQGHAELRERNQAAVAYAGRFAGRTVDLALSADGRLLRMRQGEQTRNEWVARESNRALLVGALRMGLLHNLARLDTLKSPDHAEAGVEQWVTLDAFSPTTYAQGGDLEGLMSFGFDVLVGGAPSGYGRLWLDPASGLPRRRQLTVRFAQGEMTVVEDYRRFSLE